MPATLIGASYSELAGLVGRTVSVVVDHGIIVSLWVECVSTPVTFGGRASFTILLTGPVHLALGPGAHVLRSAEREFLLVLEPVARDVRHVHYEAFLTEATPSGH